jgi:hypothetical protein
VWCSVLYSLFASFWKRELPLWLIPLRCWSYIGGSTVTCSYTAGHVLVCVVCALGAGSRSTAVNWEVGGYSVVWLGGGGGLGRLEGCILR